MKTDKEQAAFEVYQKDLNWRIAELEKLLKVQRSETVTVARSMIQLSLARLKDLESLIGRANDTVDLSEIFPTDTEKAVAEEVSKLLRVTLQCEGGAS